MVLFSRTYQFWCSPIESHHLRVEMVKVKDLNRLNREKICTNLVFIPVTSGGVNRLRNSLYITSSFFPRNGLKVLDFPLSFWYRSTIRQFLPMTEKWLHKIGHDWELVSGDTNPPCDRDCPWLLTHDQLKLPFLKPQRKFVPSDGMSTIRGINTLFHVAT